MRNPSRSRLIVPAVVMLGFFGCHDSDTTTAPGAVASVMLDAPSSVRSGEAFIIDVSAVAIGINNVRNGRVEVTLPAPLHVNSVEASAGTSATFSNSAGAAVVWTLNTLDSNSQSRLHIATTGTLAPGSTAQTLPLRASLTADGVGSGDAVAQRNIELTP